MIHDALVEGCRSHCADVENRSVGPPFAQRASRSPKGEMTRLLSDEMTRKGCRAHLAAVIHWANSQPATRSATTEIRWRLLGLRPLGGCAQPRERFDPDVDWRARTP
jgi:hypothetical protein